MLYVPPEFQARPYTPATATATVGGGQSKTNDGLLTAAPAAAPVTNLREGVIVLAASTRPLTITYQAFPAAAPPVEDPELLAAGAAPEAPPQVSERLLVPVELLAALNAADASFTLVLAPERAAPYTTAGLSLADLAADVARARPAPMPTPGAAGK